MQMRERIARALYEREKARAERAVKVMSRAAGRPVTGMAMEPWEECRDVYLGDADTVLGVMREPDDLMGLGLRTMRGEYRPGSHSATQIWQAMIDYARTPPEGA